MWFDDDSDGAGRASGPTGGKDQANVIMMVQRLPRVGISPSPLGCSCFYIPCRVSVLEGVPAEGLSTGLECASYGSALGWAEGAGEREHMSGAAARRSILRSGQKVLGECGLHLDKTELGRQGVHQNNASGRADGVNMTGACIVPRRQKVPIECGLHLDKTELGRQGLWAGIYRLAWRVPRQAVHRLARKSRKSRKSDHRLAWNSDNPFS